MGTPFSLPSIGMKREGIDHAVKLAMEKLFYNPSPLAADRIRVLLEDAFEGRAPRS